MPRNIKHPDVDPARELARPNLLEEIAEIQNRLARHPVLDPRSAEEILGYDDNGLPS